MMIMIILEIFVGTTFINCLSNKSTITKFEALRQGEAHRQHAGQQARAPGVHSDRWNPREERGAAEDSA